MLAIYELANSYRHGWGVQKDAVAARSYYECAANLGDTDAMNEVARCYDEGEGGKRDRVSSDTTFFVSPYNLGFRTPCACVCVRGKTRGSARFLFLLYTVDSTHPPKTMIFPSPPPGYVRHPPPQKTKLGTNTSPLTMAFSYAQYKAAQYYRLAESKGSKTLGNSWYAPPPPRSP